MRRTFAHITANLLFLLLGLTASSNVANHGHANASQPQSLMSINWWAEAQEFTGKKHGQGIIASLREELSSAEAPNFVRREKPALASASPVRTAETGALLLACLTVLFLVSCLISSFTMSKQSPAKVKASTNLDPLYPWPARTSVKDILACGPTCVVNINCALKKSFADRGLSPVSGAHEQALVSFLVPAEAAGKTQPRAFVERNNGVPPGFLGGKRSLAVHLSRNRIEALGPLTYLHPGRLRTAVEQGCQPPDRRKGGISPATANGLWFLKHSTMDRNEGVMCFKDASDLLVKWESLRKEEQLRYVAQAEVPRPYLLEGRKMMVRAYVATLPGARIFLNRELLLKGHPKPYDAYDPDPQKQVVSCVNYPGVISSRGTTWSEYQKVWPKLCAMMSAILGSSASFGSDQPFSSRMRATFQDLAANARSPFVSGGKPGTLKYNLIGVDIIVDRDLRLWLIELNPGPAMGIDERDHLVTDLRAEVFEDLSQLLVDPLLRAANKSAGTGSCNDERWSALHRVSNAKLLTANHAHEAPKKKLRGFVEI